MNEHEVRMLADAGRPHHLLMAEDDMIFADYMLKAMGGFHQTTKHARDGRTAMELIEKEDFDAVLLDWSLPWVPGRDVFHRIRQKDKGLPVVIITGNLSPQVIEDIHQIGFAAPIIKPWGYNPVFVAAIMRMLGVRKKEP